MFDSLSFNAEDQFILIDYNGTELFDTKKSNFRTVFNSSVENESLSGSSNNMTSPIKFDTLDHFNIIKDSANDTSPTFDKVDLGDQMSIFWKSIKINDSNWYTILLTKR